MLNPFLFPFLSLRSKPKPQAETSSALDTPVSAETDDSQSSLSNPAPASQPEAPRRRTSSTARAKKAADHTAKANAVTSGHRTNRPKGAAPESTDVASGSKRPEADVSPPV